jgi:hypothetical protein
VFRGYWLLSNALQFDMSMYLKFKEEFTNPLAQIHLIDDEYGVVLKLVLFASNIKKEIYVNLEYFLSFLKRYE